MSQINAHAYKEMLKENLQKQNAGERPTFEVGNAAPISHAGEQHTHSPQEKRAIKKR